MNMLITLCCVVAGAVTINAADTPRREVTTAALRFLQLEGSRPETSGIAASQQAPGLLWGIEDGANGIVFAFDRDGKKRGAIKLAGVNATDIEDLAAFKLGEQSWLCLADTGHNDPNSPRQPVRLYFLQEPKFENLQPSKTLSVSNVQIKTLAYPHGQKLDCEAVAIDGSAKAAYLIGKLSPYPLFRADVTAFDGTANLEKLAELKDVIPQESGEPARITALDFSAQSDAALVLTYGTALVFKREAGSTWADALKTAPRELKHSELAKPKLPQAEAACFSAKGGTLYIASEQSQTLLRILNYSNSP